MEVASLTIPLFSLILIGFLTAKWQPIGEDGLRWMNTYIIYIALPALFFQLIRGTPLEQLTNIPFITATTSATLLMFILAYVLGRTLLKKTNSESVIMGVAGSYANIGFMGPALTLAAFGEAAVVPTALVFCFDNTLLFTMAPLLMALGQGKANIGVVLAALKKVMLHPFILSTLVAILFAWGQWQIPQGVETVLDMLKNSAAPCALFTMGVVIARRKVTLETIDIPIITVIKLLLHPLLVYLFLSWQTNMDPVWIATAVLMASLPTALNAYVFAQQYQAYVREASSIVLVTTVLAVFSVTMILWLVKP